MKNKHATVVGGGLAGCEAAMQLASRNIPVTLYEMKPVKFSPAHKSEELSELVCSNSLKAERIGSASGLLKREMRVFGSVCLEAADAARVPAGGALAVDRDAFSRAVTERIEGEPLITVLRAEVTGIPSDGAVIIAAGPLASDALSQSIAREFGGFLSFFDAAAPIVTAESINMDEAFTASRYDRGGEDDYINCPLDREQYEAFYEQLITAQSAELHEFDVRKDVYEGCMPIEALAKRGHDSIRFGPLKPVGLRNPKTGHRPWANLQLRRENREGTLYNLVGFQTNLTFPEQKRVFSMFPALGDAEFVRYGVMHRNTFLDSPRVLNPDLSAKGHEGLFFAGQITGSEGYMESASSGILAGINAARFLLGEDALILPDITMLGAVTKYVTSSEGGSFQPMGAAFGLIPPLETKIRDKRERYEALAARSLEYMRQF